MQGIECLGANLFAESRLIRIPVTVFGTYLLLSRRRRMAKMNLANTCIAVPRRRTSVMSDGDHLFAEGGGGNRNSKTTKALSVQAEFA